MSNTGKPWSFSFILPESDTFNFIGVTLLFELWTNICASHHISPELAVADVSPRPQSQCCKSSHYWANGLETKSLVQVTKVHLACLIWNFALMQTAIFDYLNIIKWKIVFWNILGLTINRNIIGASFSHKEIINLHLCTLLLKVT